jgi:hypothetical protein
MKAKHVNVFTSHCSTVWTVKVNLASITRECLFNFFLDSELSPGR